MDRFMNILKEPSMDEDMKIEIKHEIVESNGYQEVRNYAKTFREDDKVLENSISHPHKRKYQCDTNDWPLLENDEIRNYLRVHKEMNAFECSYCGEAFSDNEYLKCHIKIHFRDETYQCHKCDHVFLDYDILIKHMRTHFKDNLYQCSRCNKDFSENYCITWENEYLCSHCYMAKLENKESKTTHLSHSYKKSICSKENNVEHQIVNQNGTIKDISINLEDKLNNFHCIKLNDHKESNQEIWYGNEDHSLSQHYQCPKKKYEDDDLLKKGEDHRILYICCIAVGTTKTELRKRFSVFGTIKDMTVVFRCKRTNYCCIKFKKHSEAYHAMKHGNDDISLPAFHLSLRNKPKNEEDDILEKKWTSDQVIYIGCIIDGTSIDDIRDRFNKFGSIIDIVMIFSGQRNNYCFITYSNHKEANKAIKNGNSGNSLSQYYICSRRRYDEDKLLNDPDYSDIFIGCISEEITIAEISSRFSKFGTITNLCMIFSDHWNNYGYIRFTNCKEALKAITNGNNNTLYPYYYLCSGGKKKYEGDCKKILWREDYKSIYISYVTDNTTVTELRNRFKKFGTIAHISLLSKDLRNNFCFITFKTEDEAYEAIKHGNDDMSLPNYYISFKRERKSFGNNRRGTYSESNEPDTKFDELLKAAMKEKQIHK